MDILIIAFTALVALLSVIAGWRAAQRHTFDSDRELVLGLLGDYFERRRNG